MIQSIDGHDVKGYLKDEECSVKPVPVNGDAAGVALSGGLILDRVSNRYNVTQTFEFMSTAEFATFASWVNNSPVRMRYYNPFLGKVVEGTFQTIPGQANQALHDGDDEYWVELEVEFEGADAY